jgi:hypothetical protein
MGKNRTIFIFLKTSKSVFIFMVGLLLVATPSFLAAQEKSSPPEVTQVTITTSGRADYRYFTLENPPRLVIHFESLNVFNDLFEDQQEFPEGVLVSMEAQYYPKPEGQARTPLQSLILTLRSPTTYQVIEEENAIEVMLKDTSLVAKEEGIPTELAITRVVSGPKDLTAEQNALIDTFSLVKARQIAAQKLVKQQAQILQVSDQRSPSERGRTEGRWWILAGLLSVMGLVSGWLYWRNRVIVLTVKKKKEELGEIEKLCRLQKEFQEASSRIEQTQTELDTERAGKEKIVQELETLRNGYAALEKEKQEFIQRLELQHQQETVSHREFEEKLSGAYAKIEQTQTELDTERAGKEKALMDLKMLKEELIRARVETHAEAVAPQKSPGEHREFPRIQLKKDLVLIRVQNSSQDTQPFFNSAVLNLSAGGLCTKGQTHWKFPQQSQFRLFFFGNPHPIHGIARKIWERKQTPRQTLVGITFDSISGQDRSRIRQYVEKQ